jgi:hypothetical protein
MKLPNIFRRKQAKEVYRAAFDKTASTRPQRKTFQLGEHSWYERCKHYDELTDAYSLSKVAPFTIAGLTTAQGVYFKPAVNKADDKGKPVSSGLDQDAFDMAEEFKQEQHVNSIFYETSWRAAKYGGCFWEITDSPIFGFRLPPMQECIEPAEADAQGTIVKWRQVVNHVTVAEWTNEELILIPFLGVTTDTWPFAPSIFAGTETELEMLTGIEESAKAYSEKQAWPYEVLALGDATSSVSDSDYEGARNEWRNRQPGEGLATRNMPVAIVPGGTGSAPLRDLAVLCELMKDNVQDSVMIAPISKLYNATEASAKEMTKHIMTVLGQPWQWQLASYFEQYILKPYIVASGFSVRSLPKVVFESPDVHKAEEGQYWTSLVSAKIQTPQQACDHLGLEYDQEYWDQQVKMEQDKFQQQLDAKAQSQPFGKSDSQPKQDNQAPKAKEVWKVERMHPNS